jgi:hypothetical protein
VAGDCCTAGFQPHRCRVWVRLGHSPMSVQCPVLPKADTAGRLYEYTPSVHTGRNRLSKKCESRFTLTDGESGSGHDATVARCVVTSPGPSLGSGGSGRSGRASVVPETQAVFCRRRHQPRRPALDCALLVSPGPDGCARRGWGATSRCRTPAWLERSLPPPALGECSHRNLTTRQL